MTTGARPTSTLKSIYIAGKMQDDDWRRNLFDNPGWGHHHPNKNNPVIAWGTSFSDQTWPEGDNEDLHGTICGLDYTGPFFVDTLGGHGYHPFPGDKHGSNINHNGHGDIEARRKEVQSWCFKAIARADVVFAWIDGHDCWGTIAEIGYAKALEKIIWIASPRFYSDMWFVYQMADRYSILSPHLPRENQVSLRELLEAYIEDYRRLHPHFDSPIEQAFWDEWWSVTGNARADAELEPQYPIGKYRVDFAHIATHTAIELDGHATHSSPDAIAYDRKRQREIEEMGWHVIRFGGKEIYSNVSQCVEETVQRLITRYKRQRNEAS